MRTCLAILLAVFLSLNTAYAAVVGVCDVLEHTEQDDKAHFGHHSHQHADEHEHDAPPANADGSDKLAASGDHDHAHVHPGFSTLVSSSIGLLLFSGRSPLVAATPDTFVSAAKVRLDRPPRAALA